MTELIKLVNAEGTMALVLTVEPEGEGYIRSGDAPDLILRIVGPDCSMQDTTFDHARRERLERRLERLLAMGFSIVDEDTITH